MNANLQLNGTPEEIAQFFLALFGEPDKEMNILIPISNWSRINGDKWNMDLKLGSDIESLRLMSSFEILLLKLKRGFCKIVLDEEEMEESVSPEAEPEADWS